MESSLPPETMLVAHSISRSLHGYPDIGGACQVYHRTTWYTCSDDSRFTLSTYVDSIYPDDHSTKPDSWS